MAKSRFPWFQCVSLRTSQEMAFCPPSSARTTWFIQTEYGLEVRLRTRHRDWRPENNIKHTPGLEVVKLPKVEPVGGIVGGYLDL
jgi:hypothetical protein